MSFAFISYSTSNSIYANNLAKYLRENGFTIWIDNAELRSGDNWWNEIIGALKECSAFIVVMTPEAKSSRWVQREVTLADNWEKPLFPVLLYGENWEIFVLNQYWDARKSKGTPPQYLGMLPDERFISRLMEYVTKSANSGSNLASQKKPSDHLVPLLQPLVEESSKSITDYLNYLILTYTQQDWTNRSIDLIVETENSVKTSAKDYLRNWVESADSWIGIVGDFGSGKTWLTRWLAKEIASKFNINKSLIPIILPLAQLVDKEIIHLEQIKSLCIPEFPVKLSDNKILFILDGLDELISLSGKHSENAIKKFKLLIGLIPNNSKIILTCRKQVFEQLYNDITQVMEQFRPIGDLLDRSQIALGKALGTSDTILKICDLNEEQSEKYLENSGASEIWEKVKDNTAYRQLAQLPFTLYLLENALPYLTTQDLDPLLPDLYESAIRFWLTRDVQCSRLSIDRLFSHLEAIASSELNFQATDKGQKYNKALINTGLITKKTNFNRMSFAHHSIFEYFLARAIVKQLCEYNASLLSRLNLVYAYNLNRFMIPFCLSRLENICESPIVSTVVLKNELKTIARQGNQVMSSAVMNRLYLAFIAKTKWRLQEGYGIWRSMASPDNNLPYHGDDSEIGEILTSDATYWYEAVPSVDEKQQFTTNVSWYDAFLFSRWVGGRLPTTTELIDLHANTLLGSQYEWTSTWFDERRSLISIVNMHSDTEQSELIQGLNPDIRFKNLGFRVVFE